MTLALSSVLTAQIDATLTDTLDLATGSVPLSYRQRYTWATGTAASQADRVFHDTRTLAASATEDLDLAGSLTGAFGTTTTFVDLKAILISAADGNTNNVRLTRPANGVPLFLAQGDGLDVYPGGTFMWIAPGTSVVTVTAGTGDLLTITNSSSGSSVTYDVVIIGTSA
jgi:hypothetical protein